jgi:uncharacterized protein YifN (PemK superfamily)
MAISFAPKRGAILMCDFQMAFVPPEMIKYRQVVVLSVDSLNHKFGQAPGLCSIVPFSTAPPSTPASEDYFIPSGTYRSLPKDSWARGKMVMTVSHTRLGLVRGLRRSETLSAKDMTMIEVAVSYALGLP